MNSGLPTPVAKKLSPSTDQIFSSSLPPLSLPSRHSSLPSFLGSSFLLVSSCLPVLPSPFTASPSIPSSSFTVLPSYYLFSFPSTYFSLLSSSSSVASMKRLSPPAPCKGSTASDSNQDSSDLLTMAPLPQDQLSHIFQAAHLLSSSDLLAVVEECKKNADLVTFITHLDLSLDDVNAFVQADRDFASGVRSVVPLRATGRVNSTGGVNSAAGGVNSAAGGVGASRMVVEQLQLHGGVGAVGMMVAQEPLQ